MNHINAVYVLALSNSETRQKVIQLAQSRRPWINYLLLSAIIALYTFSIFLLCQSSTLLAWLALPLLSFSMILAWYLSHDVGHLLFSRSKKVNYSVGELLSWINGVSYFSFREYCHYHLRHHGENVDLVGTKIDSVIAGLPPVIRKIAIKCEQGYIPLLHFAIKYYQAYELLHSSETQPRLRILGVSLLVLLFFGVLGASNWIALPIYFLACCIRVHCVRFVDAFQHSYEEIDPATRGVPKGKNYEQLNTYSFPVARHYKFLNLLILNFGYHNAHHAQPNCPWYQLPKIDLILRSHTQEAPVSAYHTQVRLSDLLAAYHQHRIERILHPSQGHPTANQRGKDFLTGFQGAFTDKLLG